MWESPNIGEISLGFAMKQRITRPTLSRNSDEYQMHLIRRGPSPERSRLLNNYWLNQEQGVRGGVHRHLDPMQRWATKGLYSHQIG